MAQLKVPPTKSSLLRVKRELAFAQEGYELLEQKRQILVIELMNQVARARTIEQEINDALTKAFRTAQETAMAIGIVAMRRETIGAEADHQVSVVTRPVMGVTLPTVRLDLAPLVPRFAPGQGTVWSDRVVQAFREVLALVGELAETETVVFRVARELRKTQRRVNALEKIFIPTYRETIRYIGDTLEERDREGFVVMKMLKAHQEAQGGATS